MRPAHETCVETLLTVAFSTEAHEGVRCLRLYCETDAVGEYSRWLWCLIPQRQDSNDGTCTYMFFYRSSADVLVPSLFQNFR